MKKMPQQDIAIIGGGIGGLCAAIALNQLGQRVRVFERAPVLKGVGAGLGLAVNAIKALEYFDMAGPVKAACHELAEVSIRSSKGVYLNRINIQRQREKLGAGSYAIHRADLHQVLMDALGADVIQTGKALQSLQQDGKGVRLHFEDGSMEQADYLIGADGIHSVVRTSLFPHAEIRYAGYTCWRAVIDADPREFDLNLFSETWGMAGRFGIVPLSQNRIYLFATKNAPQNSPEMRTWKVSDLQENFKQYHDPIPRILDYTQDQDLIWNDIIDLAPIPNYAFERVLLIGDAAHATTPNMGQGACMAIEDAAVLKNCLKKYSDPTIAFRAFEELRLARTHKIVKNSWRFGKMSQSPSRLIAGIRNLAIRLTPDQIAVNGMKWLSEPNLQA